MSDAISSVGPQYLDEPIETLMRSNDVPGMSVAISRDEHLVFAKGYGVADPRTGENVTPDHRFRIASVSKPVTAVAIMYLTQEQRFDDLLDRRVFGEDGVLGHAYGTPPYHDRVYAMTVRHLLQNTSGWTNDDEDPMFFTSPMSPKEIIDWMLHNREPANDPGTNYHYLNFGFCLLGRIIERLTSLSYETFGRRVLAECGISGMEIGGSTLAERRPGEVVYTDEAYELFPARMDAHGGWIASPIDLLRLAIHSDGLRSKSSILLPDSTAEMLTPSAANPEYALGWVVRNGRHGHDGGMPGTASGLVRRGDGVTYAFACNSRPQNESFHDELKVMLDDVATTSIEWTIHDLL